MKTLIELYDERAIENVLATEMFHPEETVLICPPEMAENREWQALLRLYFDRRGCQVNLTFVPVSLLDAVKIKKAIHQVLKEKEDCALDISGGTDATLFAAGAAAGLKTPVFTYSRKRNTFYEIQKAPFARSLPCTVRLDAASCFLMAGGELLPGREDNASLRGMLPQIDAVFACYARFRTIWNRQIACVQHISLASDPSLSAAGKRHVKVDHGWADFDPDWLADLAEKGLITDLQLTEEDVSFRFADEIVRFWLRDVGAALELYVFKTCLDAGVFDDVVLSAVVSWRSRDRKGEAVTNEIDVMAVRGVQPLFISCKTCEIKTEALNELAILRDRFGGEASRAMIVTSSAATRANSPIRRRAAELKIEVVDWDDLAKGRLAACLRQG